VFVKQINHEKLALNKSNKATTCQFFDLDMSLSHAKFKSAFTTKRRFSFIIYLYSHNPKYNGIEKYTNYIYKNKMYKK